MRQLSATVQQNLFTTVAGSAVKVGSALGRRHGNVFNNKAVFKVLLSDLRKGTRKGPAMGSAYTSGLASETQNDNDDERPFRGTGHRVAAGHAVARALS